MTRTAAALLFGLFAGQLILPEVVSSHPHLLFGLDATQIHPLFSILYITSAATVFAQNPGDLVWLMRKARKQFDRVDEAAPERTPFCARCKYRLAVRRHPAST